MSFFDNLPPIQYRGRIAPNILKRIAIPKDIISQGELYQPYVIDDGDRPETIAHLYYNDVHYDWLIRLANNIYDEASQWPLTQNQLIRVLRDKYGSIESIMSTIHHYVLKSNIPNISSATYDSLTLVAKKYWIKDGDSYSFIKKNWNVSPSTWDGFNSGERDYWQAVSTYDYKFQLNEDKRFIRLIDRKYTQLFNEALREVVRE